MDDLQRLRYVTRRYAHLQGLRLVPLGIPFLLSAAWRDGQLRWVPGTDGNGPAFWFAGLLATALMVATVIGRHYRRRFGTVQHVPDVRASLIFAVFLSAFAVAMWLQDSVSTGLSLPMIVIGTGIGYVGVVDGNPRGHYLALAALCLLFANLGSFGVPLHARDVLMDDLIAMGLITVGVGDHLLLRRTLEPVHYVETI